MRGSTQLFYDIAAIVIGAWLVAVGFNRLLIPHELLSGGVSGVAMIVGYLANVNIALLYFIGNLPIMIWGFFAIGRRFIVLSAVSVLATTWFLEVIPVRPLALDAVLASVFGGVIVGVGTGLSLRAGGSTGGFDIIGSILTRRRDFPLGMFLTSVNFFIILLLAYLRQNWDLALYSMLSMYITGRVVDTLHVRHLKVTAYIVTDRKDALLDRLLQMHRGVTVVKTEGAYTRKQKHMLMTVTTRYELAELRRIIRETDPEAFVNVVGTVAVMGQFHRV